MSWLQYRLQICQVYWVEKQQGKVYSIEDGLPLNIASFAEAILNVKINTGS